MCISLLSLPKEKDEHSKHGNDTWGTNTLGVTERALSFRKSNLGIRRIIVPSSENCDTFKNRLVFSPIGPDTPNAFLPLRMLTSTAVDQAQGDALCGGESDAAEAIRTFLALLLAEGKHDHRQQPILLQLLDQTLPLAPAQCYMRIIAFRGSGPG